MLFQDEVAAFSVPGLSQTRLRQGQLFGAGVEAQGLGDLDPALGVRFGVVLVRQFGEADAGKVVEHGSLQGGRLLLGFSGDG